MTWENASCASGPLLIAWLEERRELPENLCSTMGEGFARRIQAWKAGHYAQFWTVDGVLTRLGLHVSMVPDEVWLEGHANRRGPPEIRSTRQPRWESRLRCCKRCGKEIARKQRGKDAYEVAEFCSLDCTQKAKGGWLSSKVYFAPKDAAA